MWPFSANESPLFYEYAGFVLVECKHMILAISLGYKEGDKDLAMTQPFKAFLGSLYSFAHLPLSFSNIGQIVEGVLKGLRCNQLLSTRNSPISEAYKGD